jgi:ketosteroid isomerase-like protein
VQPAGATIPTMKATTSKAVLDALAVRRAAFQAALHRGDVATAAAEYTEDARLLAPSAEVMSGREAITRYWQAGIDAGLYAIELYTADVSLEPDATIAYEIGRYAIRLALNRGEQVVDRGRYLLVYRLEPDGQWRRAVETFNPDVGPTAGVQERDAGVLRGGHS